MVATRTRILVQALRRIVRVGLGIAASVVVVSFWVADRILPLIRGARVRRVVVAGELRRGSDARRRENSARK